MSRTRSTVVVDDIQIRLYVEIEGTVWVTSWYGPGDPLRFVALRRAPEPLAESRYEALEDEARRLLSRKIQGLSKLLAGEATPTNKLEALLADTPEGNELDDED